MGVDGGSVEASQAGTGGTVAQPVERNKVSRRKFLAMLGALGASTVLRSDARPPTPVTPLENKSPQVVSEKQPEEKSVLAVPEKEPQRPDIPLIVDFTPLPDDLTKAQDSELLTKSTRPFDIAGFFDRLTGSNYKELEDKFKISKGFKLPLYAEPGIDYLLEQGLEKEALCLSLAMQWSYHGVGVALSMKAFRESQTTNNAVELTTASSQTDVQSTLETVEETPTFNPKPYEILPLQDFITAIQKSDKADQWGNPRYFVSVDHQKLAEALKQTSEQVINCSFTFGQTPVRMAYTLPEGQVANIAEGWIGGEYAGVVSEKTVNEMITYATPAITIETPYSNPANLDALGTFARMLPNKIVVAASGNSQATIGESVSLPENCVLVSDWNADLALQRPEHGFYGPAGVVYYVDPSGTTGEIMSSLATGTVSEWLSEQQVQLSSVKAVLNKHSKLQVETGGQILDIGMLPTANGDWDNSSKYIPVN